jgi:hypothetical protein
MLRRVALVRTDVSEERSASIISVTRIGELGTTLAVTSNRRTLRATRHIIPEGGILEGKTAVGVYFSKRSPQHDTTFHILTKQRKNSNAV